MLFEYGVTRICVSRFQVWFFQRYESICLSWEPTDKKRKYITKMSISKGNNQRKNKSINDTMFGIRFHPLSWFSSGLLVAVTKNSLLLRAYNI